MSERKIMTIDANEAAASVAYRTNEVIAIYPITPASAMGEHADAWAVHKKTNIWGTVPSVAEMQAEGGAAGAVHGALQAGAVTTTFTASQGLLLMMPNMYKIAGELNSYCMHVAARTVATHALSIFADHSDVMACRQSGFALLASSSVQEAHDFALLGQAASMKTRVPFLHFFDGFRTSHEINKIEMLSDDDLLHMIDADDVAAHRSRALTPDNPVVRGTAQNPDTFFQTREACNTFYDVTPEAVQATMDKFAKLVGREYHLFDYYGADDAERIIIIMGSAVEPAMETVDYLQKQGEKVGVVNVRLYRPFSVKDFIAALPKTVKGIAVMDRTKEPGSIGEPLYQDVITAIIEMNPFESMPVIVGGRYGLSSKEFTPGMVKGILDELKKDAPKNHFTIGINDDVTHTSLDYDQNFHIEADDVVRAVFFGLGSDGTVGANKNTIKIIGEETPNHAQGYFVFDSKKSGAVTVSHLRFGPRPIRAPYLIDQASFVGCHQPSFLERYDVLSVAAPGSIFLLNTPKKPDEVWASLNRPVQEQLIAKNIKFYSIDAYDVAEKVGMGGRINTIMQTCFFAISGVLPRDEAILKIKEAIKKTYSKRGPEVVEANYKAVDSTLEHLFEVTLPEQASSVQEMDPAVSADAPEFVQNVTSVMIARKGDDLPVSAFPVDGTWPVGTTKWEKRNVSLTIPKWNSEVCIQCNKCALVCPHATIRVKVLESKDGAPETFNTIPYKARDFAGMQFRVQVSPEDCTGCGCCVAYCLGKERAKNKKDEDKLRALEMTDKMPILAAEQENFEYFLSLPEIDRSDIKITAKTSQLLEPLFEFSGACAGCGETPYIKLLTQLYGDRLLIANATGCSSIFGGNLPTTPYTSNEDGRGPVWSNSLFEDNAEFGFGFHLAVESNTKIARELTHNLGDKIGGDLTDALLTADQSTDAGIDEQRERIETLREKLEGIEGPNARRLETVIDYLARKTLWIVGGDGWAYDIGFGGLDHVLGMNKNVNILVLDTEVYSNTGGQSSKATPLGASAKFAMAGKSTGKKDLGMMAMSYGNVYVAKIALGASDKSTVQALMEAEAFPGPSLVIAYAHCIAHGYDLVNGLNQQKLAVDSGIWPLYRFDPRRIAEDLPPLVMDCRAPKIKVEEYMRNETRFTSVERLDKERFDRLLVEAQTGVDQRFAVYQQLAGLKVPKG